MAWEYLEVQLFSDTERVRGTCNGEGVERGLAEIWYHNMPECLNHHGSEGWELIKMGANPSGDGGGAKWYLFKRES